MYRAAFISGAAPGPGAAHPLINGDSERIVDVDSQHGPGLARGDHPAEHLGDQQRGDAPTARRRNNADLDYPATRRAHDEAHVDIASGG